MTELRGTWFVVPTPFTEAGAVDLESQRRVVESAIEWGVDGLTVMGVTSEADELSEAEREAALEAIAASAEGRVPVVVGCSAKEASTTAERAILAAKMGAAAAMVAAPPGTAPDAFSGFLEDVSRKSGSPLVVQDEPAATGVVLSLDHLAHAVARSGARVVKLEHPPTAPKIAALLDRDPSLAVFGGLGGVSALAELRVGACGTMTGFAFPEILAAVRSAHQDGDRVRSAALFDRYLPLIQYEATFGLSVRKELLRRRGAIATAVTRRRSASDSNVMSELEDLLARLRLRPTPRRLQIEG